jgi:hypothetical protein
LSDRSEKRKRCIAMVTEAVCANALTQSKCLRGIVPGVSVDSPEGLA